MNHCIVNDGFNIYVELANRVTRIEGRITQDATAVFQGRIYFGRCNRQIYRVTWTMAGSVGMEETEYI